MSHFATAWAIKQRGLKPATKIVLFYLADRHNPDFGCFPSHKTLAEDCEMSERSVRDHLEILEAAGLISRMASPSCGRFKSTRYVLGFEDDFAPTAKFADGENASLPTAKFAAHRRQNLPTNLVKEPCKEPPCAQAREAEQEEGSNSDFSEGFWTDLLTALGIDLASPGKWWSGERAHRHVARWLEAGLTEAQIIAAARKSREAHPIPPDGPKGLDAVMAAAGKPTPTGTGRKGASGKATEAAQEATPEQMARFWAEKLRAGSFVAPSSISLRIADLMLVLGLVAPSDLRGRGIAFTYSTPQGGKAA